MAAPDKISPRVNGLDCIRFVAALVVVFCHLGGPPIPEMFPAGSLLAKASRGLLLHLWCGPAAVAIFFVISGFCIHLPYAKGMRSFNLGEFLTRRSIRIGIPLWIAVVAAHLMGLEVASLHRSVLWSLVCELIYYGLYPVLRPWLQVGASPGLVLGVSFLVAAMVYAIHPQAWLFPYFSGYFNWILGLPLWLCGCWLANRMAGSKMEAVPTRTVWCWRATIAGLMVLSSVLRYSAKVSFFWSLSALAVAAVLWLERELSWRGSHPAPRGLEWAGAWSYSLYLFHFPVRAYLARLGWPPAWTLAVYWPVLIASVLTCCLAFYWCAEYPGHRLARKLGGLWTKRAPAAAAVAVS